MIIVGLWVFMNYQNGISLCVRCLIHLIQVILAWGEKKARVQTYLFYSCGNICFVPEDVWVFWIYIGDSSRILDKPLKAFLVFVSEVA